MRSLFSCLGSFLLFLLILVLIRFLLPEVWMVLLAITRLLFYSGFGLIILLLLTAGYFTAKNWKKNEAKREAEQYARVTRTEALYHRVSELLRQNYALQAIPADEILRSELLIQETLPRLKQDLIRLKDFTSPKNEKALQQQWKEYRQNLQKSSNPSVKQVLEKNLQMLEEKKTRMQQAREEIREKEALLDLMYNRLRDIEEDIRFGRPVQKMFPDEVYQRVRLLPPEEG